MMRCLAAGVSGLVFGLGLVVSGMINPGKVLSFFDIAGEWDLSLALVMVSAIPLAGVGFFLSGLMKAPALSGRFNAPVAKIVDMRLLSGALLFGVGWGLAGYCPGPAIAALAFGAWKTCVFVAALLAGMGLCDGLLPQRPAPSPVTAPDRVAPASMKLSAEPHTKTG